MSSHLKTWFASAFVALALASPQGLADGPSCKTMSVAASKVWLEKDQVKHTKLGSLIDWLVGLLNLGGLEDKSCDFDERSKDIYYVDADLDFQNVGTFTIPDMIPVVEGKSRPEDSVTLEMGVHDCDGFTGVVTCTYKRKAPKLTIPLVLDEWTRYRFQSCTKSGLKPGKTVTANALSLHINAGGKNCPDRRTTVKFNLNACDVGDLLPANASTASVP